MIDRNLLSGLVCPQSQGELELAHPHLVDAVNGVILELARVSNPCTRIEPLDVALYCRKSALLYPVRNGIPVLLLEEAIRVPIGVIHSLDLG